MSVEIEFRQTVLAVVSKWEKEDREPDVVAPVLRLGSSETGSFSEVMSLWILGSYPTKDKWSYRLPVFLSNTGEVVVLGVSRLLSLPPDVSLLRVMPLEEALGCTETIKSLL